LKVQPKPSEKKNKRVEQPLFAVRAIADDREQILGHLAVICGLIYALLSAALWLPGGSFFSGVLVAGLFVSRRLYYLVWRLKVVGSDISAILYYAKHWRWLVAVGLSGPVPWLLSPMCVYCSMGRCCSESCGGSENRPESGVSGRSMASGDLICFVLFGWRAFALAKGAAETVFSDASFWFPVAWFDLGRSLGQPSLPQLVRRHAWLLRYCRLALAAEFRGSRRTSHRAMCASCLLVLSLHRGDSGAEGTHQVRPYGETWERSSVLSRRVPAVL